MKIHFSRHARRRARLYHIEENVVEEILREENLVQGKHAVIRSLPGFIYPLKIVVVVEGDVVTVVTNYPLKKGRQE